LLLVVEVVAEVGVVQVLLLEGLVAVEPQKGYSVFHMKLHQVLYQLLLVLLERLELAKLVLPVRVVLEELGVLQRLGLLLLVPELEEQAVLREQAVPLVERVGVAQTVAQQETPETVGRLEFPVLWAVAAVAAVVHQQRLEPGALLLEGHQLVLELLEAQQEP